MICVKQKKTTGRKYDDRIPCRVGDDKSIETPELLSFVSFSSKSPIETAIVDV